MADFLKLKKSNCKNCYKCIRHCPVKSIRFSGNQANIVSDECILCGQCFVVCPQNAKEITDSTEFVKVLIQTGEPVIASVAPSFVANYDGVGIESFRKALKKLGFADAEETAVGATFVKREYERILKEENRDVLISSCCHSINLLIQKHFPALLPFLADVLSPMQAHCVDIKKRIPNAKTVFIGPCVAKKDEADKCDFVDGVLTFEELTKWFESEGVELEKSMDSDNDTRTRIFPTTGGVLRSMTEREPEYTYLAVDGIDNCISALNDIAFGNVHKCFIEMSACRGSCIGGPVMEKYHKTPIKDFSTVSKYSGDNDFNVTQLSKEELSKNFGFIMNPKLKPSEIEIRQVLAKMGKTKPEDELNCGSCGYNTCREKAMAIIAGKAEISMCLPFLKERAESFSDNIINNTPNGIIVLNEELEVQQINNAACKIMNIRMPSDVMGEPIVRILDPSVFLQVKSEHKTVSDRRVYLAEYEKYVEQTVVYDKDHIIICIMRDVTNEEKQRSQKEKISQSTVEIADKVVEKQMRIVQEIASLLGETAAETKIALTKLKESIYDE